ncbi:CRE-CCB-2 protein [Caenorhabditis remanei]|uniref:CRE-CCB-2 protein n=1 Tax=Caenorhabditis remanei TaxID=31234 RepID=E3N4Q4_CAERE|nr:CRE-CCB-2 protein [Caenorhabditis remanei]
MHSVARENLQAYLHSYKLSSNEPGIKLMHNSQKDDQHRKDVEYFAAIRSLQHAKVDFFTFLKSKKANFQRKPVAFAVQAMRDYDGSLDEKSPLKDHTISFQTNDFIHIHAIRERREADALVSLRLPSYSLLYPFLNFLNPQKFNSDWWIGRIVRSHSEFGFVPTARRLANYMVSDEDPTTVTTSQNTSDHPGQDRSRSIWEPKCPYKVVPSSRPIVFLGPTLQHSRLTQLLHLALREEILKYFGKKIKYVKSDIGSGQQTGDRRSARWLRGLRDSDYDRGQDENQEVELIMRMTSKLHLLLVDSPHIHTPDDVQHLPLSPIFFLIRVSDNKILAKLLRNTGTTRMAAEIEVANVLKTMNDDRVGGHDDEQLIARGFEMVIEENGLKEATWRIISYLEKYIHALHYHPREEEK